MYMLKLMTNCAIRIAGAVTAVAVGFYTSASDAQSSYGAARNDIRQYLDRLVGSYPGKIDGYDNNFLILKNGMRFPISDGRFDKTFEELLENPDIDDMFYARYPEGETPAQPAKNVDPGRVRFEPLFVAMYGNCDKNEVAKNLRAVAWLPKHGRSSVMVTVVNGVADALEKVSRELDELPDDLIKYAMPTAGTYSCRNIAGSKMKSMHAFGAAIDINTRYANYWRWTKSNRGQLRWLNHIPVQIVRIFEKHGFIWGGRWYHYDTMHFEYRPELLGYGAGSH